MVINAKDGRKMRNIGNIGTDIFFIIFGLLMFLMAVISIRGTAYTKEYVETTGTIVEITEDQVVYVEYEVDGTTYKSATNTYSSTYKIGKELDITYNPENPAEIISGGRVVFWIIGIVGLAIIAVAVFKLIQGLQRHKRISSADKPEDVYKDIQCDITVSKLLGGFRPKDETSESDYKEYYFHFGGKANQGHLMETPEREQVYGAVMSKFRLFSACDYDFVDFLRKKSTHHKLGKTITSNGDTRYAISWFSIDGENVHDIVHTSGYTVDTNLSGIGGMNTSYTIYHNGNKLGDIVGAGTAIMENVKSTTFSETMVARGFYKIYTAEENVPVMFLFALIFARTDQTIYE